MKPLRIGLLGAGNMAGAIISGLIGSKVVDASGVRASDTRAARLSELAAAHGIQTHATNADVVRWANVLVLSVKPDVVPKVLTECSELIGPEHLVVSIAAGVSTRAIEGRLAAGARVVRAMPNTAATVLAAATAIAAGSAAKPEDIDVARTLFSAIGRTVVLDESLLDAVTGLSGSGPAYVLLFIEALADGGVKVGLPRDVALTLAAQTVYGAAKLLLETGEHPARLKDAVTSPGGTTIAGLRVLEDAALRGAVIGAVERATERSAELGKRNG